MFGGAYFRTAVGGRRGAPPDAFRRSESAELGPANNRRVVGAPRCTIRPGIAPCWHLSVTAGWNDAPRSGGPGAHPGRARVKRASGDAARNADTSGLPLVSHLLPELAKLTPQVIQFLAKLGLG